MFYRKRAELALGKPLPLGAEVHHVHDRADTLVICQDREYHLLLHARMRARGQPSDHAARISSYRVIDLRGIDDVFWSRVKAQAKCEGRKLRGALLHLLHLYADVGMSTLEQRASQAPPVKKGGR